MVRKGSGGVCFSYLDYFQIKPAYPLKERKTTTGQDKKPTKLTGGQDITLRFHLQGMEPSSPNLWGEQICPDNT